jgi:DNA repair exonuclease SbcCD ATPase subunit
MIIKSVSISNILSVQSIQLSFGVAGMVLLQGWNHDDNTANGAGKTAVFNALSFGLYGKMPRNITSSEYLRRGAKAGFVEVNIEVNGDIWTVRRERPTNLTFLKNGETENITQEAFEKVLGLTYSQFITTVYASQLKTDRFILLNDSGKKDFLLQLLNMEKFNVARTTATQLTKDISVKIGKLDLAMTSTTSKIQTSNSFLVDEEEVKAHLAGCDSSILETQIQALSAIQKPDLTRYQTIESGIAKKQEALGQLKAQYQQERYAYTDLYSKKKTAKNVSTLSCPHCSDLVVLGQNTLLKATDAEAQRQHIQQHNDELEAQMLVIGQKIDDIKEQLTEEVKLTELAQKIKNKQREESEEYIQAVTRISTLQMQKQRMESEIASWHNKLKESDALRQKIEQYSQELAILEQASDKLRAELTEAETLVHIFSPTGVSAYIFDMVLDMLNTQVTEYIESLWPNASYQLLSFKETKAGETRAKFSEKIILGGKETSLGALSGGELRCLSLAVDLAIVDIVSRISGIQINPLILDEPFDGMDASNKERAMELISKLSKDKEIWVIDHSSELQTLFSRVVKVEKRNEVTALA